MCDKHLSYWKTQKTTFSLLQRDLSFPFFSLCFENFKDWVLIIFFSFSSSHRSTQTLCVPFSSKPTKLILFTYPWMCGYHKGSVSLPADTTLKKVDSSSPWNYPLLLRPGWAVITPLSSSILGFGLFWAFLFVLWIHSYSCPAVSRWPCFSRVTYSNWPLLLFCPLLCNDFRVWGLGDVIQMFHLWLCSTQSFILCTLTIWVCV